MKDLCGRVLYPRKAEQAKWQMAERGTARGTIQYASYPLQLAHVYLYFQ